jgi:hypothetical protein
VDCKVSNLIKVLIFVFVLFEGNPVFAFLFEEFFFFFHLWVHGDFGGIFLADAQEFL